MKIQYLKHINEGYFKTPAQIKMKMNAETTEDRVMKRATPIMNEINSEKIRTALANFVYKWNYTNLDAGNEGIQFVNYPRICVGDTIEDVKDRLVCFHIDFNSDSIEVSLAVQPHNFAFNKSLIFKNKETLTKYKRLRALEKRLSKECGIPVTIKLTYISHSAFGGVGLPSSEAKELLQLSNISYNPVTGIDMEKLCSLWPCISFGGVECSLSLSAEEILKALTSFSNLDELIDNSIKASILFYGGPKGIKENISKLKTLDNVYPLLKCYNFFDATFVLNGYTNTKPSSITHLWDLDNLDCFDNLNNDCDIVFYTAELSNNFIKMLCSKYVDKRFNDLDITSECFENFCESFRDISKVSYTNLTKLRICPYSVSDTIVCMRSILGDVYNHDFKLCKRYNIDRNKIVQNNIYTPLYLMNKDNDVGNLIRDIFNAKLNEPVIAR